MTEIRIVQTWDEIPPVVEACGEVFSIRVLEKKYQDMGTEITRLREENSYVNDMLENAHNRCKLTEQRVALEILEIMDKNNQYEDMVLDIKAKYGLEGE